MTAAPRSGDVAHMARNEARGAHVERAIGASAPAAPAAQQQGAAPPIGQAGVDTDSPAHAGVAGVRSMKSIAISAGMNRDGWTRRRCPAS
jgi:hypothetical protein